MRITRSLLLAAVLAGLPGIAAAAAPASHDSTASVAAISQVASTPIALVVVRSYTDVDSIRVEAASLGVTAVQHCVVADRQHAQPSAVASVRQAIQSGRLPRSPNPNVTGVAQDSSALYERASGSPSWRMSGVSTSGALTSIVDSWHFAQDPAVYRSLDYPKRR